MSEEVAIPPQEWLETYTTLDVHAPNSSPSGVTLSFVVSSLVCLAVHVLVLWIGGGVVFVLAISSSWLMRSLGRDDTITCLVLQVT